MGRGDKRTRRGKIWRGTSGKTRPNARKVRQAIKAKLMEQGKSSKTSGKGKAKAKTETKGGEKASKEDNS